MVEYGLWTFGQVTWCFCGYSKFKSLFLDRWSLTALFVVVFLLQSAQTTHCVISLAGVRTVSCSTPSVRPSIWKTTRWYRLTSKSLEASKQWKKKKTHKNLVYKTVHPSLLRLSVFLLAELSWMSQSPWTSCPVSTWRAFPTETAPRTPSRMGLSPHTRWSEELFALRYSCWSVVQIIVASVIQRQHIMHECVYRASPLQWVALWNWGSSTLSRVRCWATQLLLSHGYGFMFHYIHKLYFL